MQNAKHKKCTVRPGEALDGKSSKENTTSTEKGVIWVLILIQNFQSKEMITAPDLMMSAHDNCPAPRSDEILN